MEGRMRKVDKSTHGRRGKNRMKKIEEKNNPETARDRPEKVEKQYRKKLEMRCEGTRVNTNTCIIIFEYKTLHARIQKMFPVGPMQIYFLPGRLGRGGSKTYFFKFYHVKLMSFNDPPPFYSAHALSPISVMYIICLRVQIFKLSFHKLDGC